jgi:hypothetical protein
VVYGTRFEIGRGVKLTVGSNPTLSAISICLIGALRSAISIAQPTPGGVVEWSIAPVLKTGEPQGSVGSNPTPSASFNR